MLPFAAYTSPVGPYNAAAHFARDRADFKAHAPDLGQSDLCFACPILHAITGPKMYIATGDRMNSGTTNLHLDVTSAVNILVYTDEDEPVQGAEWTIFRHEDAAAIREYLRSKFNHTDGDPILSQRYFLSAANLQELRERGVRAFSFTQRKGDAVMIPVGCAHQVSGRTCHHAADCHFSPYRFETLGDVSRWQQTSSMLSLSQLARS